RPIISNSPLRPTLTSSSNRILYLVSLNHATNDGSVYLLSSLFPIVLALFNISVFQVGIIVALGYLVNILFQPVVGHYSEGRDPGKLLAIGISIIAVSVISFVFATRSEEHTSELQSRSDLVCRLLLEKKKK